MPNLQHWMFVTGVCASCAVGGCGSDATTDAPGGDGGTDTNVAFDSTGIDTKGIDTNGIDTNVPTPDTATSDVPIEVGTCSPADGGDAGSVCPAGQWRDFSGGTCKTCPATALVCPTSFDPTKTKFDTTTHLLTVALAPGKTQVFSGKAALKYTTGLNCYGASGPSSGATILSAELPIVPDGDAFTVDFTSLGTTAIPCGTQTLTATDACCSNQSVRVVVNRDIETSTTYVACPTIGDGGTDAADGG